MGIRKSTENYHHKLITDHFTELPPISKAINFLIEKSPLYLKSSYSIIQIAVSILLF